MTTNHFDEAAATWDNEPRRIALMKAVGEAVLQQVRPTREMNVLDYGCGTGLVGLFLLPYVCSVTGADSSAGMLDVLRKKIAEGGIDNMTAIQLDLECDSLPADRYQMVVTSMALHHIADTDCVLRAFRELLVAGGMVCIADLDTEPGLFHPPDVAASVHHHGFDRGELKGRLERAGFRNVRSVTAHTVRRPVQGGEERDFPIFLMIAER
jgi:ubiquinone/menaquinone biosynthesis C-methylase UbiE